MLPAWKVGDRGLVPRTGVQVSKQTNISSPLTRKDSVLWPRGSVLDLRPSGLEFQILCLEGSVISFISFIFFIIIADYASM